VQLETSAQGLLIRPAHKYTLDELVVQFDASAAAPDDQIGAWNDAPAIGREAWWEVARLVRTPP